MSIIKDFDFFPTPDRTRRYSSNVIYRRFNKLTAFDSAYVFWVVFLSTASASGSFIATFGLPPSAYAQTTLILYIIVVLLAFVTIVRVIQFTRRLVQADDKELLRIIPLAPEEIFDGYVAAAIARVSLVLAVVLGLLVGFNAVYMEIGKLLFFGVVSVIAQAIALAAFYTYLAIVATWIGVYRRMPDGEGLSSVIGFLITSLILVHFVVFTVEFPCCFPVAPVVVLAIVRRKAEDYWRDFRVAYSTQSGV